jgi:hypothetical protein
MKCATKFANNFMKNNRKQGHESNHGNTKGDQKRGLSLAQALPEIVETARSTQKRNTALNTAEACLRLQLLLPPECFFAPMNTLSSPEFDKHVQKGMANYSEESASTKKLFMDSTRRLVRILVEKYDLTPKSTGCPNAPEGSTKATPYKVGFLPVQIKKMENKINSSKKGLITEPFKHADEISETAEGLYYFGSAMGLQSSDVVFCKWTNFDENLELLSVRRRKTKEKFTCAIPKRLRRWLVARRQRGNIWGGVYVFPELVFGTGACCQGNCNDMELSLQQQEKIFVAATKRLAKFFDPFLKACDVKKKGVSYNSFPHPHLSFPL